MKVHYVTADGWADFADVDELRAASERLGLTEMGLVLEHVVPALHGLPRFVELAGPFGPSDDGSEIRYETWEAYERSSN